MEPTLNDSTSTTSMKRKIDEAFDALDDALQPRDRPSTPKRTNNSIYGSLAKYGIRTFNNPFPSRLPSTPTLSALLSRSRSKNHRKPHPVSQPPAASSAVPDYSPSSTEAFLQRISTFTLSTYSSKPPQIDAVAASKAGWINEGGKDRLYCAICKVGWIVAGRDGMNKDAGDALIERQRKSLVEMHKEGCPWRTRQCDALVYRIPLQSPAALARQIKTQAAELEPVMDGVAIRHPLSSMQVQSLTQIVYSISDTISVPSPPPDGSDPHFRMLSSTNSVLVSLFGWSLVSAPQSQPCKPCSANPTSHARASSIESIVQPSRNDTPAPSTNVQATQLHTPAKNNVATPSTITNGVENPSPNGARIPMHREPPQRNGVLLHCRMCQRRVGLWAFAVPEVSTPAFPQQTSPTSSPQRQFDILREHRSYCPFVVKSTPLPTIPPYPQHTPTPRSSFDLSRTGPSSSLAEGPTSTPVFNLRRTSTLLSGIPSLTRPESPSSIASPAMTGQGHNLVEGWRAVLSVVLRFGMAERSRLGKQLPIYNPVPVPQAGSLPEDAEDDAMSGVVALVDGVKQHGGRQLLNYVRSLLS